MNQSLRSADFQSAVSPTSNRHAVERSGGFGYSCAGQIGNVRYSRQEICATVLAFLSLFVFATMLLSAPSTNTNDYSQVDGIFVKHCLDCHEAREPEGDLVLETFEALMKGGTSGPSIVPGKSAESLLVKMIDGGIEKDGKKVVMPPGKRKKLATNDIAVIKAWIDAGAKPPQEAVARLVDIPKIAPTGTPRNPINAMAYASKTRLLAVARYAEVELYSGDTHAKVRTLTGLQGNVAALAFSKDGKMLFTAGGDAGIGGEAQQWDAIEGKLVRSFTGHKDALYAVALSPDGKTLATGSYDQAIKLWNTATGEEIKTLSGHNGAVFGLAFRPDGKILASASADRTIKLWDVAAGERRDTLSQPLKEQNAVVFSADGQRLFAAGVDNRIRVWQISDSAAETTNPLLEARFAHEGAILHLTLSGDGKTLVSSADDRSVKLWDSVEVKERLLLEKQSDWPQGIAMLENKVVTVGCLDGSLKWYDASSGKVAPPPKPELVRLEPRGIQRGLETKLKLVGSNLVNATSLKFGSDQISGEILHDPAAKPKELWIKIKAESDLTRGDYELWVQGPGGDSAKVKLYVDDLPQVFESADAMIKLPATCWGVLQPMGDKDEFEFEAKRGQVLVFDLAAKSFASKANAVLTLSDAEGKVLASNNDFDGGSDPLIIHTIPADGSYRLTVHDLTLGGSKDHAYRVTMGELPYVTGYYPLSVQAGKDLDVELIGHNIPPATKLRVKAEKAGEIDLPLNKERFRARRQFKIMVAETSEKLESEPNDQPSQATLVEAPGAIAGRFMRSSEGSDVDLFRFKAKAGQAWIIETLAARRSSPADTKIEVLHADGRPVQRLLLQATRNSAVTFRGVGSDGFDVRVENWEEMELNQYLYMEGEVVRLFRAPQGPDSGFFFYTSNGKRRSYFDTSAAAHPLDEPCYIVEPHPPGAKIVQNGLPVFTLFYANDDDGDRKSGSDSKLNFTAPKDGEYLVRVTETRGYKGERYGYRLNIRRPEQDFEVTLNPKTPTVNIGSGQGFTVTADRLDGFEGEIKVELTDAPAGLAITTPLVIQEGHTEAKGTIFASKDVSKEIDTSAIKVSASAMVNGKQVSKAVQNFGKIKVGGEPKLFVALEPYSEQAATNAFSHRHDKPLEITIAPGQVVPAILKLKRNGHEDLVTLSVENLPHGVIVDNIGLNGVLIPKGENERQIFLAAARWVPETDRLCYALENQAGKQTSYPVMIHIRKGGASLAKKE